ncbi:MAG: SURF1 family protein [Pseudohongiellaceae bacterium]
MQLPFILTRTVKLGALQLRINWLILFCVVLTVFTFIRLGLWQLGRASQKLAAQAEYDLQQRQNPLPLENLEIASLTPANDVLQDLHVALYGEYENDRTILVMAQFFNSQIGYEVVTPFRLRGSDRLVLVSRGWTSGILPPNTPPDLRPVFGLQRLTAQIHVPDPAQRIIASQINAGQWPLRVRSVEVDVLQEIFGEPLFPFTVRLTPEQAGVLVRHWPTVSVDINNHLSYALQWFTFSAITLIVSLLLSSNLLPLLRERSP